jgi:GH24 family phage-related lysozyme (muramidase)
VDAAVQSGLSTELNGDEGIVLKVYDDKTGKPIGPGSTLVGFPTIGVGRNLTTRGITLSEASMMETTDIAQMEEDLVPLLPWIPALSTGRQVAVYSLYFNVALGNPQKFIGPHGWPTFLAQMAQGQFDAAAQNLRTSQPWATEVGPRSGRLADLVQYG